MRVNLNVPYAERDAARAAGAKWDVARKVWYWDSSNGGDLDKRLLKWMPSHLTRKTTASPASPASPARTAAATVKARSGRA